MTMIARRSLLCGTGALLASAWMGPTFGQGNDIFPVVETAEGKVQGLVSGGINVFKGLNYAADTSGANRFRSPQPLQPWAGVKNAIDYGNVAPQVPSNRTRDYADLIMFDMHPGGMGEDNLNLNLWTPTLDRNAKKPVIVRFHGGGFYGGSSNNPGSDGEMLSRFGDCVAIGVNHRLSSLGYLWLGDEGEFADSASVGMQDLVACLQWINRNIENFGGDPSRVLIMGQSGGGAKVSHLLGMPSASGLYSSAGVMSGARLTAMTREAAEEASTNLLRQLGLTRNQVRELQAVPFETLLAAQAEVEAAERAAGEAPRSFSPTIGQTIPHHPFAPGAPAESLNIPMVVSNALDERTYRQADYDMGWDAVLQTLRGYAGDDAQMLLNAYRDEDPGATPFIINARVVTDNSFAASANTMAERKAAAGCAPVWKYLWTAPSDAYGGRYGAVHGADVPFSMHEVRGALAGPTANNRRLADEMASVWVNMAAKGDPNSDYLPDWPAFTGRDRATMVFDKYERRTEDDPRSWFRQYWAERSAPAGDDD